MAMFWTAFILLRVLGQDLSSRLTVLGLWGPKTRDKKGWRVGRGCGGSWRAGWAAAWQMCKYTCMKRGKQWMQRKTEPQERATNKGSTMDSPGEVCFSLLVNVSEWVSEWPKNEWVRDLYVNECVSNWWVYEWGSEWVCEWERKWMRACVRKSLGRNGWSKRRDKWSVWGTRTKDIGKRILRGGGQRHILQEKNGD